MVVSQFVFMDQNTTATSSNIFANSNLANCLTLSIDDFGAGLTNLGISIEGSVDQTENTFYPITVVSLKNFKKVNTINSSGLYLCIVSGVSRIKLTCANASAVGQFKAFAVGIE